MATQQRSHYGNNKGSVAIFVALTLVVLIGIAAFAVDVGYTRVARTELQRAADAGALAGARQLGENYDTGVSPVSNEVLNMAQTTASKNKATGINLEAGNVVTTLAKYDPTASPDDRCPDATTAYPDAVKVTATRNTGTPGGAVSTFFAPIFRLINPSSSVTVDVGATACAAISGICTSTPGIPLGIGRAWFENIGANRGCTQIAVNSTKQSCAGWTNLSTTKKYDHKDVENMLKDPTKIPEVNAGDVVDFGGGTTQKVVDALDALFRDKEKFKAQKTFDAAGNVLTWTTEVVVYEDSNSCENPQAKYEILGFATIKMTGVITTGSAKGPVGEIQCKIAEQERGGCYYAGTYGVIPGLVQ